MTATDFASLALSEPLLRALSARDYSTPTPIQASAIPHLLDGRDLLGIAQTGTGKTAAFALPILQRLNHSNKRPRPRMPRALVLAPTRELATQIADSFRAYGRNLRQRTAMVFGGVGQNPQVQALRRGLDVLVATPGRLLDLIQQRHCDLGNVEILVLDEADRMLDMGFLPDVKRIIRTLPSERQSLLFSATMPDDITELASKLLDDPIRVEVSPSAATADRIEQSVWMVKKARKRDLLAKLLAAPQFERTLVFTRTRHGADRVVRHLQKERIEAHAIHGDKSQNQRNRALAAFRAGDCHVLVATDIAARGIDVKEITHVINFDLPNIADSYVHRIGRTARAGRDGIAISFCDDSERAHLRDIEKLIRQRITVAGQFNESPSSMRQQPRAEKPPATERPRQERPRQERPRQERKGRAQRPAAVRGNDKAQWFERFPVERYGQRQQPAAASSSAQRTRPTPDGTRENSNGQRGPRRQATGRTRRKPGRGAGRGRR